LKLLLSHPLGNANVRAAASGFLKAQVLSQFYTTIACFEGDNIDRLSNLKFLSEFRRRKFDISLKPYTQTFPWHELARNIFSKIKFTKLVKHETGIFSVDAVYKNFDKQVSYTLQSQYKQGATAIYAYEDGAIHSFEEAKHFNMKCLYDLPIGYWRASKRILKKELERWPEWQPTLIGFEDSEEKLARKDEELKLADHIFVASQFTADTLKEYPYKLAPVSVIPYGFPQICGKREYEGIALKRKLKLLFVGGLSQRKGIADLFAAVEKLKNNVELTVVGRKITNICPALDAALAKHKWIPSLPHNDILNLMQKHDVLVFPSLFEGFGLVITEAMSQGTPVITTERTAGPDLIKHGENGWLINAGSTEALIESIENLLIHPELLQTAGRNALETAKLRPWDVYGSELASAIKL
jgi:glycosyltransferase involved in cell wall biosynthesis